MTTRVAFVTPFHFDPRSMLGGGERYPLNLARGIVRVGRGGWSVDIVSFGAEREHVTLRDDVGLVVLPQSSIPGDPADALSWELAPALAGYDLIHTHQGLTRSGVIAMLAARLRRVPLVVTDHGGSTLAPDLRRDVAQLADAVIAYSDFGTSSLPPGIRVDVVKGGVDGSFFTPAGANVRTHVLYAGRLLPHKGVDGLLRALPDGVRLVLCGARLNREYGALLDELAAGRDVQFVAAPGDDELRELYRSAICTVLPSVYLDVNGNYHRAPELMGLTLLESMACGTPVVCTRVGGMPEFVRDGVDGFVCDDLASLRTALTTLTSDAALVERMGAAGRAAVDERWDVSRCADGVLDVYRRVLAAER